jgi:sigma-B regulation protein RsbU (phosphoserine phosphatase)
VESRDFFAKIEARLGFVPPFFEPAAEHPELLANLWQQTETAYLDNPLPALFKEKLAALLGRYCEVPYCLVCHTCSLRPLGMQGPAILDLLTRKAPSDEEITTVLGRLNGLEGVFGFPLVDEGTEADVLCLANAVYFGRTLASPARECLRRRLSPRDYRNVIVFTAYNKMCHEWMAAHPEVSYEVDRRYLQNHGPISAEAPGIADFFESRRAVRPSGGEDFATVAEKRAEETARLAEISERRLAEVLRHLTDRIASATKNASEKEHLAHELARASEFAQELLAIVSHDLRTPLNTIVMGTSVALKHLSSDQVRVTRSLDLVLTGARRAERLIHELLDFSQARAGGGIPIRVQPADLHELARSTAEEFLGAHPGLAIRPTQEGVGAGEWDADRLRQVISNLLANAESYGRKGAPIILSTAVQGDSACIVVRNENESGPIPADLLPILFDPFKRGAVGRSPGTRSIGLGLYIVDQLVKGHRGRVDVASSQSSGTTTFTVYLPRTRSSPPIEPRR